MSRIIAGFAKGARLVAPTHSRTRPTTDRVREAVFSSLAVWAGTSGHPGEKQLAGIALLDLFAGSGAVGLEAASRGASPVVCVEKDKATGSLIAVNVAATKLAVQVVVASALDYVSTPASHRFDIVYCDPPYDYPNAQLELIIDQLIKRGWLADDALVVVERAKRDRPPQPPPELAEGWSRSYGETAVYYFRPPKIQRPNKEKNSDEVT